MELFEYFSFISVWFIIIIYAIYISIINVIMLFVIKRRRIFWFTLCFIFTIAISIIVLFSPLIFEFDVYFSLSFLPGIYAFIIFIIYCIKNIKQVIRFPLTIIGLIVVLTVPLYYIIKNIDLEEIFSIIFKLIALNYFALFIESITYKIRKK